MLVHNCFAKYSPIWNLADPMEDKFTQQDILMLMIPENIENPTSLP